MAVTHAPWRVKELENRLNFARAWFALAEWLNGPADDEPPTPRPWPDGWANWVHVEFD